MRKSDKRLIGLGDENCWLTSTTFWSFKYEKILIIDFYWGNNLMVSVSLYQLTKSICISVTVPVNQENLTVSLSLYQLTKSICMSVTVPVNDRSFFYITCVFHFEIHLLQIGSG
jgi:hypothetical protein